MYFMERSFQFGGRQRGQGIAAELLEASIGAEEIYDGVLKADLGLTAYKGTTCGKIFLYGSI